MPQARCCWGAAGHSNPHHHQHPGILAVIAAILFASTVISKSLVKHVEVDLLTRYWREIFQEFIGSTIIRMIVIGFYAQLSRFTTKVTTIPGHWWQVLTASGVKGAFSLLMLHMIPHQFEYRELFEAIVVGNVLLSTFLYPLALVIIIKVHQAKFEAEYQADHLLFEE